MLTVSSLTGKSQLNIVNFFGSSSEAPSVFNSPVLWAGVLGAVVTILGFFVNNILIEGQKKSEFERQRTAKKEDNLYEIRKEAYLDFCSAVTSFCSNLQSMADPNQVDQNLTYDVDLSAVGRVYMVASPKLVEQAMMLVSEMEYAHRSVALQLVRNARAKREIEAKYALFDAQQKEMDERLKYMRSVAEENAEIFDNIKSLENESSELVVKVEQGRKELASDLYRVQLTTLETAAIYVRSVETQLLSVLFYVRNEIGLQFDISSVIESMNAEHARKTDKLKTLIDSMQE